MMRAAFSSLAFLTAGLAHAQTSEPAEGEWQVCNQTSFVLRVAAGYQVDDALQISGWRGVNPGGCLSYDVESEEERYLLAESDPAHQGGIREWKGDVELCAGDADFEADGTRSCALQDLETRQFLRVAADDARTLLVEPEEYGSKAEVAGIQRLLRDAGYKVRRIDGLTGRGTTRTRRQFLKDQELDQNIEGDALFAALVEAARKVRAEVGLTLCNETKERVWGAMAFRRDGIWRSRGWWAVEAGECGQLSTEPLSGLSPHIFALQEDTSRPPVDPDDPETDEEPPDNPDRRLRTDATQPSQFCISDAKFAAVGRDQCRDRGYVPTSFRVLPDDQDGVTITVTDADFVAPTRTGLRR